VVEFETSSESKELMAKLRMC